MSIYIFTVAAMIETLLYQQPIFMASKNIGIYLSSKKLKEIRTDSILRQCFLHGLLIRMETFMFTLVSILSLLDKKVFVPSWNKRDERMELVLCNDWIDFESLPMNQDGIKVPIDPLHTRKTSQEKRVAKTIFPFYHLPLVMTDTSDATLDLLIVPGLAYDKTGVRLGRGKGQVDSIWFAFYSFLSLAITTSIFPDIFDSLISTDLAFPL
jgi:5-formyltetrahydrofolate cyclo-ligase